MEESVVELGPCSKTEDIVVGRLSWARNSPSLVEDWNCNGRYAKQELEAIGAIVVNIINLGGNEGVFLWHDEIKELYQDYGPCLLLAQDKV